MDSVIFLKLGTAIWKVELVQARIIRLTNLHLSFLGLPFGNTLRLPVQIIQCLNYNLVFFFLKEKRNFYVFDNFIGFLKGFSLICMVFRKSHGSKPTSFA